MSVWCIQLIDMLDQRVSMQHDVLVQCAVTAARTNEMQLESDVLRHKLSELTYVHSHAPTEAACTFQIK